MHKHLREQVTKKMVNIEKEWTYYHFKIGIGAQIVSFETH